ncbi:MAG: glycine cleavage system aminomethyltransferase GcvT [Clostridiales bacterium]|nr:glycine cleavage system aminomethyltransferase GcvT [Clostridiales bacterium]
MDRTTPLYDRHVALGGKMVAFGGYLMPVQYAAGVIAEHMAVRQKAGLFDISHMGEVEIEGPDALANLQKWLTNDFSTLSIGQVRYSPMCNERGGVIDDLIVYRTGEQRYFIVVNASNREKDVAWMRAHLAGDAALTDRSDGLSAVALQGPSARAILEKLADRAALPRKYYTFADGVAVAGAGCLVSRTGYTGELGYELYLPNEQVGPLWDALLAAGRDEGLLPCGLGARDTLRLEAAMPLYGHEMDDAVTPIEAGLSWAVKPDGRDFIGRDAMLQIGARRGRVGLKVLGRGIAREHQTVTLNGRPIGHTTSGTFLPFLGGAYAMALVETGSVAAGDRVAIDVRGRMLDAEVVPLPFYKRT